MKKALATLLTSTLLFTGCANLNVAVIEGDARGIKSAIEEGANPNMVYKDDENMTVLYKAVEWAQPESVKALLENGAKVDIGYLGKKQTPLHRSTEASGYFSSTWDKQYMAITKTLLKHGADVNALNDRGLTPYENALYYRKLDIAKVIKADPDFKEPEKDPIAIDKVNKDKLKTSMDALLEDIDSCQKLQDEDLKNFCIKQAKRKLRELLK